MNILITGTSSGLGFALAKQYLDNGATVYGLSRGINNDLLHYAQYFHKPVDLSLLDEIPGKLADFISELPSLDLVILNAATLPQGSGSRLPVDQVTRLMKVNVWANKIIIDSLQKLVPAVHQVVALTTGKIINSIRGLHTYCLSKSILNKWIKLYAEELPDTHFSALSPGFADSGLQHHIATMPHENCQVTLSLKKLRQKGMLPSTPLAANFLVELMGTVLHHESGSYYDAAEHLPQLKALSEIISSGNIPDIGDIPEKQMEDHIHRVLQNH